MTLCENEFSSVNSGANGVNSDIGALADFSDDDEETRVEQLPGCRIPGCQCEGHIFPGIIIQILSYKKARETRRAWAENNERPVEQRVSCRVPGCQCNGRVEYMDWGSEDMTETDDSEYEETETDIEESICSTIDDGFLTDEESPNSEQMVQPRTVADKDFLTVSDRKDNRGGRTRTGSDEDITSVMY